MPPAKAKKSPKRDPNDVAAEHGSDWLRQETEVRVRHAIWNAEQNEPSLRSILARTGGRLRAHVIKGLLRCGEVGTIVAPPKIGKSWLVCRLALDIAAGRPFLGIPELECEQGNVVICDNELHDQTSGYRFKELIAAGDYPDEVQDRIRVYNLRGERVENSEGKKVSVDMYGLQTFITKSIPFRPKLIILDAIYKFYPRGISENDNASIADMFTQMDIYARQTGAALIGIHHTSKGDQGDKDITDVGAGAGAYSRAGDLYMILRAHEKPKHYVLDGAVRSWVQPKSIVVEWDFPDWRPVQEEEANPEDLRGRVKPKEAKKLRSYAEPLAEAAFVTYLDPVEWRRRSDLVEMIREREGLTQHAARRLMAHLMGKYGLDELLRRHGTKDCGSFVAEMDGFGALRFKLKGGADGVDK